MAARSSRKPAARSPSRPRPRRRRRPPGSPPPRRWLLAGAGVLATLFVAAGLARWAVAPGPGAGRRVALDWPDGYGAAAAARALYDAGLTDNPRRFQAMLLVTAPFIDLQPGPHLLDDALSPLEIVRRLARLRSRPRVRVAVPEGFNLFQIARRLERQAVCSEASFLGAAADRALLERLDVGGPSAEGYLFPATYALHVDSHPGLVIQQMVRETRRRLERLREEHPGAFDELAARYEWGEAEILTLASMVEKESVHVEEQPIIASVFFNRLDDPGFRPQRRLQSDPTAGYGCLVAPESAACGAYAGRITPDMVRDRTNPYNTYRVAGLPPGPIANPGESAVRAVLAPADTDYLFFVATGDGRHTFSRSLEEHQAAIASRKKRVPAEPARR